MDFIDVLSMCKLWRITHKLTIKIKFSPIIIAIVLTDVITAYKGVVKEKEALESSMKALSAAKARNKSLDVHHSKGPPSDTASDRGRESDQDSESGSVSGKEFVDPLNAPNLPEVLFLSFSSNSIWGK